MNLLSSIARYTDVRLNRALRKPPETLPVLLFWITDKCNLSCRMCGDQWRSVQKMDQQLLTLDEVEQVILAARRLKTMIVSITGGEPLLHPEIFQILGFIKKNGIAANMCTNGTLLNEERVRRLADTSLRSISISLDYSTAEVHDQIRGRTGAFTSTVAGIKSLRAALPELWININCTITRENFHNMEKMVLLADDLGCNKISFAPVHTNLQHQMRPEEEFSDLIFAESDLPELRAEIRKCTRLARRKGLRTLSDTFLRYIPRFYEEPGRWHTCYAGYASCSVSPWGEVSPCVELKSSLNVRDRDLDVLWASQEFQQLRQKVDTCTNRCWDTTNAEIALRFSTTGLLGEQKNILRDLSMYEPEKKMKK